MAKFCTQCGRPLKEGEICECQLEKNDKKRQDNSKDYGETKKISKEDIEKERIKKDQKSFESNNKENISYNNEENSQYQRPNREEERRYYNNNEPSNEKNFMDDLSYWQGRFQEKVGSSFREKMDGFKEMSNNLNNSSNNIILGPVVSPSEGEIPIKQYDIATFKNMFWGILTYAKANCKLLVTNKRLALSAKGRDYKGDINYQSEFEIDEIKGIHLVQGFIPNFFKFLIGILISVITIMLFALIAIGLFGNHPSMGGIVLIALGILFTILIKNSSLLNVIASSICFTGAIFGTGSKFFGLMADRFSYASSDGLDSLMIFLFSILSIIFAIMTIFRIWNFAQVPNLNLYINTKIATSAMSMEKRDSKLFGLLSDSTDINTGFDYVIPARDTKEAIRDLVSLIQDIQNLGDDAIGKWKNI